MTVAVRDSVGPMPDASSLIRSFLPVLDCPPVCRADQVAQVAALETFSAPELRSYPINTFLGRLVCELSSQNEINTDVKLVRAVCKQAMALIQKSSWILSDENLRSMNLSRQTDLTNCSYRQINQVGDFIVDKENRILEEAFQVVFNDSLFSVSALERMGLSDELMPQQGLRGAYFKNWMARAVSNGFGRKFQRRHGRETLTLDAQDVQKTLIGHVLAKATESGREHAVRLILQRAVAIESDYLGVALLQAIRHHLNDLILPIFERSPREIKKYLAAARQAADQVNNGAAKVLIEDNFPDTVQVVSLETQLVCAVRSGNAQRFRWIIDHPDFSFQEGMHYRAMQEAVALGRTGMAQTLRDRYAQFFRY